MNPIAPQKEELVYAPAVLILSQDLYPRKLEVVREYIQNASDAIDAFGSIAHLIDDTSEPVIKVSIQGRSLLIFDNGIGMGGDDVAKLRYIAYSEKKTGEEAGYKGIGRLAGFAVAEKLKISSTCYGDPQLHHFEIRAKDMRDEISQNKKRGVVETASDAINRHSNIWSTPADDPKDHYTIVEIRGIYESSSELLDGTRLKDYIGDIAPVDFSPEFKWGTRISQWLRQDVPDYSPKTIYLSMLNGERIKVYKPYVDSMSISEPRPIAVRDPANPNNILALCWYATKGQRMLDELRPAGKIFTVDGDGDKKRFAGLVYKLFGFSVGDRHLPVKTLWDRSFPRALWFTGEIHIIDKEVQPVTDRSDFIESDARRRLYKAAAAQIPITLNQQAQVISNDRNAYRDGENFNVKLQHLKDRLRDKNIEKAELKSIRADLNRGLVTLRSRIDKCSDPAIEKFDKNVQRFAASIQKELDEAKTIKGGSGDIADVARERKMTSHARRVFEIIMDTLQDYYSSDTDTYHEIAGKISKALRKKY
jgi:hypothetical protein